MADGDEILLFSPSRLHNRAGRHAGIGLSEAGRKDRKEPEPRQYHLDCQREIT